MADFGSYDSKNLKLRLKFNSIAVASISPSKGFLIKNIIIWELKDNANGNDSPLVSYNKILSAHCEASPLRPAAEKTKE